MTAFTVYTIDGKQHTFDGNAEGFLLRWHDALNDTQRKWPYANTLSGETIINGVKREVTDSTIHFNPLTVAAVEVESVPSEGDDEWVQPTDP